MKYRKALTPEQHYIQIKRIWDIKNAFYRLLELATNEAHLPKKHPVYKDLIKLDKVLLSMKSDFENWMFDDLGEKIPMNASFPHYNTESLVNFARHFKLLFGNQKNNV